MIIYLRILQIFLYDMIGSELCDLPKAIWYIYHVHKIGRIPGIFGRNRYLLIVSGVKIVPEISYESQ